MTKVLVCRVGEDPKVEEVASPFDFCRSFLINGGYVEAKLIVVNDRTRVVCYWDEDAKSKKLSFNREVPARALPLPKTDFVIDTRERPPEAYAQPGEMGYFEVLGDFLITKADNEGDPVDLTDEELQTLVPLLELPKCKRCKKKILAYKTAVYCGAACSARAEAGD